MGGQGENLRLVGVKAEAEAWLFGNCSAELQCFLRGEVPASTSCSLLCACAVDTMCEVMSGPYTKFWA